jgi:hypothetical protein
MASLVLPLLLLLSLHATRIGSSISLSGSAWLSRFVKHATPAPAAEDAPRFDPEATPFATWLLPVQPFAGPSTNPQPSAGFGVEAALAVSCHLRANLQSRFGITWVVASDALFEDLLRKHGFLLDALAVDVKVTRLYAGVAEMEAHSFEDYERIVVLPPAAPWQRILPRLNDALFWAPLGLLPASAGVLLSGAPPSLYVLSNACMPTPASRTLHTGPVQCALDYTQLLGLAGSVYGNGRAPTDGGPTPRAAGGPAQGGLLARCQGWLGNTSGFLHIPKTGGGSLEGMMASCHTHTFLDEYVEDMKKGVPLQCHAWEKTPRHHLPLELLPLCGLNSSYYQAKLLFAVVRDPLERLMSEVHWRVPLDQRMLLDKFAHNRILVPLGSARQADLGRSVYIASGTLHMVPQVWLIYSSAGRRLVHHLAPMAHLQEASHAFGRRLGCPNSTVLPAIHGNGTGASVVQSHLYPLSQPTRLDLERFYRLDFRLLDHLERRHRARQGQLFPPQSP